MATINGSASDERLVGTDSADTLFGLGGNDTLAAGKGDDTLIGGAGDDELFGEGGVNTFVFSGNFADYTIDFDLHAFTITDSVAGRDGTDTAFTVSWLQFADKTVSWTDYEGFNITGGSGNDHLVGTELSEIISDGPNGGGNDLLEGLGGHDSLEGGLGNDTLDGGVGNDTLVGGPGNDLLLGGSGNEQIEGGTGDDTLKGGDGDDVLYPQTGKDLVDGGAGRDIVAYSLDPGSSAITVNLKTGIATGTGSTSTLIGIEDVAGTNFNDQITGDGKANKLDGVSGDDTLTGAGGDDVLTGGKGSDTAVFSGERSDYFIGLDSEAGEYLFIDSVANRDGTDVLNGVEFFKFADGTKSAGELQTLPIIAGTPGNDVLAGTDTDDTIRALSGNDTLDGGAGDDQLFGEGGTDTANYASASSGVTVDLAAGTAVGAAGSDALLSIENILGSGFADTIRGDSGNNLLSGGGGDDTLVSGGGSDTLDGGDGSDTVIYEGAPAVAVSLDFSGAQRSQSGTQTLLNVENLRGGTGDDALSGNGAANHLEGGAGNDRLTGSGGSDVLDGGAGFDVAAYASSRADHAWIATATGYTLVDLKGTEGTDLLTGIERLSFADTSVALDLEGHAGMVARLLGAVFGPAAVQNKSFVGIGLNLLDGGMSVENLTSLALDVALGGGHGNAAVVDLLFSNLVGFTPSAAVQASFVSLIDQGSFSQVTLAMFAADLDLNAANINLTGLAADGLEYF